jgi:hypothetical protein
MIRDQIFRVEIIEGRTKALRFGSSRGERLKCEGIVTARWKASEVAG